MCSQSNNQRVFFPLGFWNKRVKGFKQVMLVFLAAYILSSPLQWLDSDSNENLPFAREGLLNYTLGCHALRHAAIELKFWNMSTLKCHKTSVSDICK